MSADTEKRYALTARPCLIDLGRYRWDIHDGDSLFQSSAESFGSEQEALVNGRAELKRLEAKLPL